MTPELFPLIEVEGSPYERGLMQGEAIADRIAATMELHRKSIMHYTGRDWPGAVACATPYLAAIDRYSPGMSDELRGIAAGSKIPFEDILTLNVRAELTFNASMAQGCTSFAVLPEASANGHTYLGQTWDNLHNLGDLCVVLRAKGPGCHYLAVTEPGAPGMTGLNAAGVGVVRNALVSNAAPCEGGNSMNAAHFSIFNASNFHEALLALTSVPLATAWYYMIAAPDDCLGVENANPVSGFLHDRHGILTHANHYESAHLLEADLGPRVLPDSLIRSHRLHRLLNSRRGKIDLDFILECLSDHFDHPASICRHVDESVAEDGRLDTVFAVVMDLDAQELWLSPGNPCQGEVVCHKLG